MTTIPDLALVHIEEDAGPCVACGSEAPRGIVGWSFARGGALCDMCFVQGDTVLGRMLVCHELMKEAGEILKEARKPIDHEVATGALSGLALNHYKHCGSSRMVGISLGVYVCAELPVKIH
ncbi:MAG: hypothetical protein HC794_03530 [Nitrospiraceae bacterium]|nr:hypothetical protein [Nitrospiraceae bacterium]